MKEYLYEVGDVLIYKDLDLYKIAEVDEYSVWAFKLSTPCYPHFPLQFWKTDYTIRLANSTELLLYG